MGSARESTRYDGLWVAVCRSWEIERERFAGPATCQIRFGEQPTLTEPKGIIVHIVRIVHNSVSQDTEKFRISPAED